MTLQQQDHLHRPQMNYFNYALNKFYFGDPCKIDFSKSGLKKKILEDLLCICNRV